MEAQQKKILVKLSFYKMYCLLLRIIKNGSIRRTKNFVYLLLNLFHNLFYFKRKSISNEKSYTLGNSAHLIAHF